MTKYLNSAFRHSIRNLKLGIRNYSRTPGFSLIEVLFAITFLILVGVAMVSLNNAAARLTATTELKQIALGLNEQSLAFVALKKRTLGNDPLTGFAKTYATCVAGQTCYVVCPPNSGNSSTCPLQIQTTKATLNVGTAKAPFTPTVVIRPTGAGGRYLVNATTSWGKGVQKQLTTARIIE